MSATLLPARQPSDATTLTDPGRGQGLVDVFRRRYLLRLLVRKELRVRYRGSVVGLGWTLVKPLVQFCVYFFVIGLVLNGRRAIPDFPTYLFCGIMFVHFFNEGLGSSTRSVVANSALVRKILLPREMFPVASVLVSGVHLIPQTAILVVGAILLGWSPDPLGLLAGLLGLLIVATLVTGVGLLTSTANVYFRDTRNLVDVINLFVFWSSPTIYSWTQVRDSAALRNYPWLDDIYLANPVTIAMSLLRRGFWYPSTDGSLPLPPDLWLRGGIALLVSLVVLGIGQLVFRRFEGRFAQEL